MNPDYISSKLFSKENKYYFDVDSKYVLKKLKIVLLPFIVKGDWGNRGTVDDWGQSQNFEN